MRRSTSASVRSTAGATPPDILHGDELASNNGAMQELKERIAANLAVFTRHAVADPNLRRAAVAILLSPVDGELTFVLTRRALTMRRNAGTYALPGGNLDPGEDAVAAALREIGE